MSLRIRMQEMWERNTECICSGVEKWRFHLLCNGTVRRNPWLLACLWKCFTVKCFHFYVHIAETYLCVPEKEQNAYLMAPPIVWPESGRPGAARRCDWTAQKTPSSAVRRRLWGRGSPAIFGPQWMTGGIGLSLSEAHTFSSVTGFKFRMIISQTHSVRAAWTLQCSGYWE